ncbi:MAG: hypothetical protein AMS21_00755 [Gemmatimonas sp. SG8_38_2]|nr:MAG: hypothetical protein AMS21_00755 [Gemmatimonas sp. SG8_38_2]
MAVKLQYDAYDEIVGMLEATDFGNAENLADVPTGFIWEERIKWKWNGIDAVELKTGQELADALAILAPQKIAKLIKRHAGHLVNPVTQGSMEEICDLMVQLVHKLINGTAITQDEKDAFNLIVTTCQGNYKLVLADVDQDVADGMNAKKQAARDAEAAMKADPEWPT